MSLLNDMLGDLSRSAKAGAFDRPENAEAASAQNPADSIVQQRELLAHTSISQALPFNPIPSLVVFVLVLLGFLGWQWLAATVSVDDDGRSLVAPEAPAVSITPAASVPQATAAPQVIPSSQAAQTSQATQETEASQEAEASPVPALDQRLAALESALTLLAQAVTETKLTSASKPIQEPIAVAPQADFGQPEQANQLDSPAQVVAPLIATESVSIQDPFALESPGAISPTNSEATPAPTTAPTPAPTAAARELQITPSTKLQDQQFAARMGNLYQAGQEAQVIAELQRFINQNPGALHSSVLLLDILCDRQDAFGAEYQLDQSGFLPAAEQTYYRAKIALINGQQAEAISLLENGLAQAQTHENYRALLASLYQRTGMSEQAANHYRRLLQSFGDKPAYWLGFALAQDALADAQLALQAYQRVSQYSDLQPQVREYVEQRLSALQQ